MKAFLIICILLIGSNHMQAQSASAAMASAAIVTAVGAEKTGDIYLGNFSVISPGTIEVGKNGVRTSSGGIKLCPDESTGLTMINIIGSAFVYDITIQNTPASIKEKEIKIDFCRFSPIKGSPDNDNLTYPIGAIVTLGKIDPGKKMEAGVPFNITVNFN